jgi:phosphoglucosamine mutase
MSEAFNIELYPQVNKNVIVEDKFRIMNNEDLSVAISKYNLELTGIGRIMLRASGTEPKIRVMVESKDNALNKRIADDLVNMIKRINSEV